MTIVRVKHSRQYTVIANDALCDRRLSFRARGLHHFLLSKPENWTVRVDDLHEASDKEGRDAVRAAFKELQSLGYAKVERLIDETGRITHWETVVYEQPISASIKPDAGNPHSGKPDAGNPECGKPHSWKPAPIESNEIQSTDLQSTEDKVTTPQTPQGAVGCVESQAEIPRTEPEPSPTIPVEVLELELSTPVEPKSSEGDECSAAPIVPAKKNKPVDRLAQQMAARRVARLGDFERARSEYSRMCGVVGGSAGQDDEAREAWAERFPTGFAPDEFWDGLEAYCSVKKLDAATGQRTARPPKLANFLRSMSYVEAALARREHLAKNPVTAFDPKRAKQDAAYATRKMQRDVLRQKWAAERAAQEVAG